MLFAPKEKGQALRENAMLYAVIALVGIVAMRVLYPPHLICALVAGVVTVVLLMLIDRIFPPNQGC